MNIEKRNTKMFDILSIVFLALILLTIVGGVILQRLDPSPRVGRMGTVDHNFMQPGFSIATQDALRKLGHVGLGEAGTEGCKDAIGSVQAVAIDPETGTHRGIADSRREGTVIRVKP